MTWTREKISKITGFDEGEKFEDDQEVYAYFTMKNLRDIHGLNFGVLKDDNICQKDLLEMAQLIIENRWHMT